MNYGKVLARAWEITWRWKVLWILGFLAALGNGGGGGGGGGSSYSTGGEEWSNWWGTTYHEPFIPAGVIAAILGLLCLGIIIAIAIWVVSVIARGGLIAGVQQVEEQEHTSLGQAWSAGARRFWTLFGISILAGIPLIILAVVGLLVFIVMLAGSGFAFASSDAGGVMGAMGIVTSILCGGVFCCGMIIATIILQQIRIYAERAAIMEDRGWIDAFVRGWDVLKANLGPTIVFWLIFLVIGIAFFVAIMAVLAVTALPFIALVANVDTGPWLFAPICCGGLIAVIVAAVINAIVQTFTSATWTLAYREMVAGEVTPSDPPPAEPAEELLFESTEETAPEE